MYSRYYLGTLVLILVCIGLGLKGLYNLIKLKKLVYVFSYVSFIVGYPLLGKFILNYFANDIHTRMWIAYIYLIPFMFWLLIGYFINKTVEKLSMSYDDKVQPSDKVRVLGALTLLTGLCAWCFGLINRNLSRNVEVVLVVISFLGLLLGMLWLITGKRINDIDK